MTHSLPRRLYTFRLSGHSHRAALMLSLLELPAEHVEVDLVAGAHKQPAHVALHPFGQVPVLVDGDDVVFDSNAILVYLALRYDEARRWLPRDPALAARVHAWLGVAAGPLAQGPATARLGSVFGAPIDRPRAERIAASLFDVLERELGSHAFVLGASPTLADVALYTYCAHAPEGGIDLTPYPGVRDWLARVEALPGFVPMARAA